MSSIATLVPLAGGRRIHDLEAQARALGAAGSRRLVLGCDEPEPAGAPPWEPAVGPALHLRSPGASLEDAGMWEALEFAVAELGVEEVVLILHSRCRHLPAADAGDAGASERGLPFMERLNGRLERARRQRTEAQQRVRATIRALVRDPRLDGVRTFGLVRIVESGVLLAYDARRDDFEALL